MIGTVLDYSLQSGQGMITTDQGRRYVFSRTEWGHPEPPNRGQLVDFDVNDMGQAIQVYLALNQPLPSHTTPVRRPQDDDKKGSHLWVAIVALVIGVFAFINVFSDDPWTVELVVGVIVLSVVALLGATVTLAASLAGKVPAIISIVLSVITLFFSFGVLTS